MREILFRGKRLDNGQWVYGYYVGDCGDGACEIVDTGAACAPRITVDPATIGQYIGLQDRNGRRIFEGDIIKSPRGPAFLVEYVDDISSFAARARENTRWTPGLNKGTMQGYEVVGNRWDNPEILEVDQ